MGYLRLALVAIGLSYFAYSLIQQWIKSSQLKSAFRPIPGPKGLPLLGPVPDLPRVGGFLKFVEWSQQYGPFFGAKLLGRQFIFIASEQVANDLLVKRGAIHAGRPPIHMLNDSQGKKTAQYMALMSANPEWARHKKSNQINMQAAIRKRFYDYPAIEAKRLVWNMLQDSSDWTRQVEDLTSRIISRLCFGTVETATAIRDDALLMQEHLSPAGMLPNLVPELQKLPAWLQPFPWKRIEQKRVDKQQAFFLKNLRDVRMRMAHGDNTPSFARNCIEDMKSQKPTMHSDLDAGWALGALAVMSVFTASGPILSTIRALIMFPEWARKLQDELDTTVGDDRMPELSDMPHMPILRACIREALRCWPIIPTGIPHEAEADDIYNGYLIPKGSSLFPLELAMCRDPAVYPDPYTYNPARWLDPAFTTTYREPLTQFPTMVNATAFGWGRRYCQGQDLSQHEAFIAVASIMWAFDVAAKDPAKLKVPARGEEPMECPTSWEESLIIVRPKPVEIVVTMRGEKRRETLEREVERSRTEEVDVLRGFEGNLGVE